jgi:hypothetical protein
VDEEEIRGQAGELLWFFRSHCPCLENAQLIATASQVGVRESRHILDDYRLNGPDVLEGRTFDDAIAPRSYPIDIHDPQGRVVVWRGYAPITTRFRTVVLYHVKLTTCWSLAGRFQPTTTGPLRPK